MTTELRFLAATVILGLVHLIVDSHLISFNLGYRWTASSRDQPVPSLRGVAHRVGLRVNGSEGSRGRAVRLCDGRRGPAVLTLPLSL